ncbi:hypothetical protein AMTRI_Chr11g96690 [Amborella trichopoda]
MRRIGSPQRSRTQEGMIICRCGWLICNTRQTQARDPGNFLQSRSCLSHRRKKILTIKIEATKAISSGHYQAKRNQPLKQGPIIG